MKPLFRLVQIRELRRVQNAAEILFAAKRTNLLLQKSDDDIDAVITILTEIIQRETS